MGRKKIVAPDFPTYTEEAGAIYVQHTCRGKRVSILVDTVSGFGWSFVRNDGSITFDRAIRCSQPKCELDEKTFAEASNV